MLCDRRALLPARRPAMRPIKTPGPRNVPSSAAFPLIPANPVTSPTAKRPGIAVPVRLSTRHCRSTLTPPIVFRVIGKNWTA